MPTMPTNASAVALNTGQPEVQQEPQRNNPKRHHLDRRADKIAEQGAGPPDDLLTERYMSDWLDVSPQWLQIGRHAGYGPPYIRIGRRIRYRRSDVLRWLDERTHRSTREYAAGGRNVQP